MCIYLHVGLLIIIFAISENSCLACIIMSYINKDLWYILAVACLKKAQATHNYCVIIFQQQNELWYQKGSPYLCVAFEYQDALLYRKGSTSKPQNN